MRINLFLILLIKRVWEGVLILYPLQLNAFFTNAKFSQKIVFLLLSKFTAFEISFNFVSRLLRTLVTDILIFGKAEYGGIELYFLVFSQNQIFNINLESLGNKKNL